MVRSQLACALALLVALLGAEAVVAQEPSEGAPAASIALLNPSPAYNPGEDPTGSSDSPAVSSIDNGTGEGYRLVAWTSGAPSDAEVEAVIEVGGNLILIGRMTRVPSISDTWELFWKIPDDLPTGTATLTVRLLQPGSEGEVELAQHQADVRLRHKAGGTFDTFDQEPDRTVRVTWPGQGGDLGFFKARGGTWAAVVDGTASAGAHRVNVFYSTSAPGSEPSFTVCGASPAGSRSEPFTYQVTCTLAEGVEPSQVTAVGVVAQAVANGMTQTEDHILTQEAADVVRATGFVQEVQDMKIAVTPFGRTLAEQCIPIVVSVTDASGRPVQGANVDVHLTGPEGVTFGSSAQSSGAKAPDVGDHEVSPASNCAGGDSGEQGVHPAVEEGEVSAFHRESIEGSGLSGPSGIGPGQFRFHVFSLAAGFAELNAWLDEPRSSDGADDDIPGSKEVSAIGRAQWLSEAPSLRLDPVVTSSRPGECVGYLARARAGSAPMPGLNIDVEVTGPTRDIVFCSPRGRETLSSIPKDLPEGHPADAPPPRQAEGQTDERGNMMFWFYSLAGGNSSIVAWIDGEPGDDDEVRGQSEASATTSLSWVENPGQQRISFLDPSLYGAIGSPGIGAGNQLPQESVVRVTVRADMPDLVDRIEIFVSSDGGGLYSFRGVAERDEESDSFYYDLDVDLPRGSHRLQARIPGTTVTVEMPVQVGPPSQPGELAPKPLESLRIETPIRAGRATFEEGTATVGGLASAGTEGVDLFYTKVSAGNTPQATDWIFCGFVSLDGLGNEEQPFEGGCALRAVDRASEVTGLAAISVDCTMTDGCDVDPSNIGPLGRGARKATGESIRVYGYDAATAISIQGLRRRGRAGTCQRATVYLSDSKGEPVTNQTLNIRFGNDARRRYFCDPYEGFYRGMTRQGASYLGEEVAPDGSIDVEVRSDKRGPSRLMVWLDDNGDGIPDEDEASGTAKIRWSH